MIHKRVRLVRRADGYYAQFAIDADRHVSVEPAGTAIGIDLGLTHFYTDSTRMLPLSHARQLTGFAVFMMRQFIQALPDELFDAARIDSLMLSGLKG